MTAMFRRTTYPKITLFAVSCTVAYALYSIGWFHWLEQGMRGYGYWSILLGGVLYAFGFTAPFSVALFISMANDVHPLPGSLVAGIGAVAADAAIFALGRLSFREELRSIVSPQPSRWSQVFAIRKRISHPVRRVLLWIIAALVIASPLPDEIGVTLLAGMTDVESRRFLFLSFILNTFGILAIFCTVRAVTI